MKLAWRITTTLALLLLAFGLLVAAVARHLAGEREAEALQRLSHGLARHIVEHWPQVTQPAANGSSEQAAHEALLQMLMTVNPGIEVYLLDADGRINTYLGDRRLLRSAQVALEPVRAFLAGAALPLRAADPKAPGQPRLFSAAMFPPRPGDSRPPGYLYVVLDGAARQQAAGTVAPQPAWRGAALLGGCALVATLLAGALVSRRLARPLQRLAQRMQRHARAKGAPEPPRRAAGDEVRQLRHAFAGLRRRLARQAREQATQQASHRETVAGLAHDLRTPLTALHGHLEAVQAQPGAASHHLGAALAHSHQLRTLTQQLFELATLQSPAHVLQRERFRLDELVTDTVQKLELPGGRPALALAGPPPGPLALDGDLLLVERALTNLIGNALQHAGPAAPVQVRVQRVGTQAQVLVEDAGPGLPEPLAQRLNAGQPVRAAARSADGIGGLGLAIAQRVAWLHGGQLFTLPSPQGGTKLCLALPLAAAP